MNKTNFIFHTEWCRLFHRLSDADCKRLLLMMCDYATTNTEPEDTPDMVGMAFDCIRGLMDYDKERYQNTCEKRRKAVQKRWDKQKQKNAEPVQQDSKNTNVSDCIEPFTNGSDTEYDIDIDTECECIINNTHTPARTQESIKNPTLEQVQAYARQVCAVTEPERFYNFFQANGWRDKNGRPVQDWKAAFNYWNSQDKEKDSQKGKSAFVSENAAAYEELIYNFLPLSAERNV